MHSAESAERLDDARGAPFLLVASSSNSAHGSLKAAGIVIHYAHAGDEAIAACGRGLQVLRRRATHFCRDVPLPTYEVGGRMIGPSRSGARQPGLDS